MHARAKNINARHYGETLIFILFVPVKCDLRRLFNQTVLLLVYMCVCACHAIYLLFFLLVIRDVLTEDNIYAV